MQCNIEFHFDGWQTSWLQCSPIFIRLYVNFLNCVQLKVFIQFSEINSFLSNEKEYFFVYACCCCFFSTYSHHWPVRKNIFTICLFHQSECVFLGLKNRSPQTVSSARLLLCEMLPNTGMGNISFQKIKQITC